MGFRTGEEVTKDWWTLRFGNSFNSTFACCLFIATTAPCKGLHWWDTTHPLCSAASLRALPALGNRLFLTKASKSSFLRLQHNDNLPFRDPFCGWLSSDYSCYLIIKNKATYYSLCTEDLMVWSKSVGTAWPTMTLLGAVATYVNIITHSKGL